MGRNGVSWPRYVPVPHPDERWPRDGWLLLPGPLQAMLYGRSRRSKRKATRRLTQVWIESGRVSPQWVELPSPPPSFREAGHRKLGATWVQVFTWEPLDGDITEASTERVENDGWLRVETEIHHAGGVAGAVGRSVVVLAHPEMLPRFRESVRRHARMRAGLNPDWIPPARVKAHADQT